MIPREIRLAATAVIGLITVALLFGSFYTIEEGHVGVEKRLGKAVGQVTPGLHFKIPFMDSVEEIEVRQRKSVEDLRSATNNQLPITAKVSVNWSVRSESVLQMYKDYGGLAQFESRILNPKMRSAAKAALAKYRADELIRNREKAVDEILTQLVEDMEDYPITVVSPQIEQLTLPEVYLQAVMAKEKAREDAVKEKHLLDKQKLEAQRGVQTAEATRDAMKAEADGQAYKTLTEATAEADAILLKGNAEAAAAKALSSAISANPLLVEYERAKRWNGQMPATVMGAGAPNILWSNGK